MNCPECGNPVEEGAPFCPKCFAAIAPPGFWSRLLNWFKPSTGRAPLVIRAGPKIETKTRVRITSKDKDGTVHEYHSLEDVPPELRAEIEKLKSESLEEDFRSVSSTGHGIKAISRKTLSTYRIVDPSGQERVYHSLEEMPPELRAAIEAAQKRDKS